MTTNSRRAHVSRGARMTWGINATGVFRWVSEADWPTHFAAIASLGVTEARIDLHWADTEATEGAAYDWTDNDAKVFAAGAAGLRVYGTLDYATSWAGQGGGGSSGTAVDQSGPTVAYHDDYAAYCGALAHRYRPTGAFWQEKPSLTPIRPAYEIWNEPNLSQFWGPQTTAPEDYAQMFVLAATAIKTADPDAHVTVGALSPGLSAGTPVATFIQRMMAECPEIATLADAVSFHPYGNGVSETYTRMVTVQAALAANGLGALPIEVTETGWSVFTGSAYSEADRAKHLQHAARTLPRQFNVTRFHPYSWVTSEIDITSEDYFGIGNLNGSLKLSASVYRDVIAAT